MRRTLWPAAIVDVGSTCRDCPVGQPGEPNREGKAGPGKGRQRQQRVAKGRPWRWEVQGAVVSSSSSAPDEPRGEEHAHPPQRQRQRLHRPQATGARSRGAEGAGLEVGRVSKTALGPLNPLP
jgi:hypothetical protein